MASMGSREFSALWRELILGGQRVESTATKYTPFSSLLHGLTWPAFENPQSLRGATSTPRFIIVTGLPRKEMHQDWAPSSPFHAIITGRRIKL
ncbi:hypothetical protein M0804_005142 [Polistes exclamans]|nr:hypothetical protein M0804_005142 [Polistes exclamans]